jgi:hypothetical protein
MYLLLIFPIVFQLNSSQQPMLGKPTIQQMQSKASCESAKYHIIKVGGYSNHGIVVLCEKQ